MDKVTINGIVYQAIDKPLNGHEQNCEECDIFKAQPPKSMQQIPLCMCEEYEKVNKSCCDKYKIGIIRIWMRCV